MLATAGRRDEFTLLWRTGATRRQLRRMLLVESLVIAICAWLIGTLAIIPTVIGVSAGLLGAAVPPVAWTAYGVLCLVVVVIPAQVLVERAVVITSRSFGCGAQKSDPTGRVLSKPLASRIRSTNRSR